MYINPFLAGVLATIGVELILLYAYTFHLTRKRGKKHETTEETD